MILSMLAMVNQWSLTITHECDKGHFPSQMLAPYMLNDDLWANFSFALFLLRLGEWAGKSGQLNTGRFQGPLQEYSLFLVSHKWHWLTILFHHLSTMELLFCMKYSEKLGVRIKTLARSRKTQSRNLNTVAWVNKTNWII